jgi:hypothetical protein
VFHISHLGPGFVKNLKEKNNTNVYGIGVATSFQLSFDDVKPSHHPSLLRLMDAH